LHVFTVILYRPSLYHAVMGIWLLMIVWLINLRPHSNIQSWTLASTILLSESVYCLIFLSEIAQSYDTRGFFTTLKACSCSARTILFYFLIKVLLQLYKIGKFTTGIALFLFHLNQLSVKRGPWTSKSFLVDVHTDKRKHFRNRYHIDTASEQKLCCVARLQGIVENVTGKQKEKKIAERLTEVKSDGSFFFHLKIADLRK